MDFQKSQIISYNTYRRIAKKHNIKDETSSGKPVTYKKLRNRIQHHKNVLKKRSANEIMTWLIAYLNDKTDHEELISKLNEQINFHMHTDNIGCIWDHCNWELCNCGGDRDHLERWTIKDVRVGEEWAEHVLFKVEQGKVWWLHEDSLNEVQNFTFDGVDAFVSVNYKIDGVACESLHWEIHAIHHLDRTTLGKVII